jgi:hypothetical protein
MILSNHGVIQSGKITGGTDPFFANVPLLLKGNNIANPSVIVNSGNTTGYTVTFSNNNVVNSNTAPKYGDGALQFNPDNASNLNCVSSAFNIGSNDCTIECWFRLTGDISGDKVIWEMRPGSNGAFPLMYAKSNFIAFNFNGNIVSDTPTIVANTYYYAAVRKIRKDIGLPTERQDTELWFMGEKLGEFNSGAWGSPGRILLGMLAFDGFAPQTRLNGFIDEFRFTVGVARDVSVVPTEPFPTS